MAGGQRVLADHIDVALVELAETPALRALAAIHALHLIAAEREREIVFMFGDVAGQRHGQVEAQGREIGKHRIDDNGHFRLVLHTKNAIDCHFARQIERSQVDQKSGSSREHGLQLGRMHRHRDIGPHCQKDIGREVLRHGVGQAMDAGALAGHPRQQPLHIRQNAIPAFWRGGVRNARHHSPVGT